VDAVVDAVVDAFGVVVALAVVVGAGGASPDFDLHAPVARIAIDAPTPISLRMRVSYQYVPSSGNPRVSKAQ
jgi:hypothetical protein